MIKLAAFMVLTTAPAQAAGRFDCVELERVSLSAEGAMRPVYEGRKLTFSWDMDRIAGDGVFYHDSYTITALGADGFRAFAQNADRSDVFRFEAGILMHAAIVKYGPTPSIQSQVFGCIPLGS